MNKDKNEKSFNDEVNLNKMVCHPELVSGSRQRTTCSSSRGPSKPDCHRRSFAMTAFTLAEVLVTLSILGVVAAISIPNLIQQYQKRLNVTKLQKAYSVIETAAQNIAVNSGCFNQNISCSGLLDITNEKTFQNKFIELSGMKYSKLWGGRIVSYMQINSKNSSEKLYPNQVDRMIITKDNIGYYAGKSNLRNNGVDHSSIILFVFTEPNFISTSYLPKNSKNLFYSKKTIIGRNVFGFVIWDNFKVEPVFRVNAGEGTYRLPSSISNIDQYCNPNSTNTSVWYSGFACTSKIIKDGWKMNY